MNKIPFSRSKVEESPLNYWNQINEFLGLSKKENLSGDILAFHYLYWVFSETATGQLCEYFDTTSDWNWDQDEVLDAIKTLGNKGYADHFEMAKLAYEEVIKLSEHFDENEKEIDILEGEIFRMGAIYEEKPNALDFIESMIRNNEEKYLEFID